MVMLKLLNVLSCNSRSLLERIPSYHSVRIKGSENPESQLPPSNQVADQERTFICSRRTVPKWRHLHKMSGERNVRGVVFGVFGGFWCE